MGKRVLFILLLTWTTVFAWAGDTIRLQLRDGVADKELQEVLFFENIFVEQVDFSGSGLRGKSYAVTLDEFKEGRLVASSVLFDGTEDDIFRVKNDGASLRFFFKIAGQKLKVSLHGSFFSSKTKYFGLDADTDSYTVKDFFGRSEEMQVGLHERRALFAVITPTRHVDGTASYCEVVQSGVRPEQLGDYFHIPHYFLVSIEFR
ncbi:hypothetical protein [Prevotella sp. KH2C16]|uniref:hypothetical protein n=1 Tax=Prevotella sp. KH2C16 TaxID=1855325 RepID=UPI0008EAC555|nr:hypothetical protein [Prevotella sp. KH2C16]SFG17802.1 hypothetical protein SAMN05216383_106117 [Prevotella sp. KH2C16]